MKKPDFSNLHVFMMTSEHYYGLDMNHSDFYFHTTCSHCKDDYYILAIIEDSKLDKLVEANKKLNGEL